MNFNELSIQVGQNIKGVRKKLGLSQSEACKKTAFDKRFYQRIEAGKAGFTLRTLHKISVAFNTPVTELVRIEIKIKEIE